MELRRVDMAGIITAGVGALSVLGGGVAFVWNKVEGRFRELEARQAQADQRLEECRRREVDGAARQAVQLTVIELLWREVQRHAPKSSTLTRAKKLLDELKVKSGGPG